MLNPKKRKYLFCLYCNAPLTLERIFYEILFDSAGNLIFTDDDYGCTGINLSACIPYYLQCLQWQYKHLAAVYS